MSQQFKKLVKAFCSNDLLTQKIIVMIKILHNYS